MKRLLISCYRVLLGLALVSCHGSKLPESPSLLAASALEACGRTDYSDTRGLELISSGSYFACSFQGADCELRVSLADGQDHNYLEYEMDNFYRGRIKITRDTASYLLHASDGGQHLVRIFKATEAASGPVYITAVRGEKVKALPVPEKPLIEFIGNSITCGAASDLSGIPCGAGEYMDQHNAYLAYGPRIARKLGVNYMLSSVSGIGIYRNWNSDGPAMPLVYRHTDLKQGSQRDWQFSKYRPALISIALGTNDFSRGDGKKKRDPFDSTVWVNEYVKFIRQVRSYYGDVQLVLLGSPMVKGKDRLLFHSCLNRVKSLADQNEPARKSVIVRFMEAREGKGCTGHPSTEEQALMAEELLPLYRDLLSQQKRP